MSRRVSKLAVGILVLSLLLPAPATLAAQRVGDEPEITPIDRVVKVVNKFVKKLKAISQDDPSAQPRPPVP